MRRVGYDADTGKYYYKDSAGATWEGAEGAQYGELKQGALYAANTVHGPLMNWVCVIVVGSAPVVVEQMHEEDEDLEAAGRRADGYQPLAPDAVSVVYSSSPSSSEMIKMPSPCRMPHPMCPVV